MGISGLWRDPAPEPAAVDIEPLPQAEEITPSPPQGTWECPSCGASVASPPHTECQVCGTKPDGSR